MANTWTVLSLNIAFIGSRLNFIATFRNATIQMKPALSLFFIFLIFVVVSDVHLNKQTNKTKQKQNKMQVCQIQIWLFKSLVCIFFSSYFTCISVFYLPYLGALNTKMSCCVSVRSEIIFSIHLSYLLHRTGDQLLKLKLNYN